MKVSLNLLQQFLSLDASANEIADTLTQIGLEVDSINYIGQNLEEIIPVTIQKIEKHPTLDKVQLLSLLSKKKKYRVVCADLSVSQGQICALAPIGSTIYPTGSSPVNIKKRSFANIESEGMLCSENDLGISKKNESILILGKEALEMSSIQPLYKDVVFEISLTPNLGHCRSILGIARELSASYNINLTTPKLAFNEDLHAKSKDCITTKNNYQDGCAQYIIRVIKNVEVKDSSPELRQKIEQMGYQSVNNVVDCLNYTMHMYGQPLHGFDLDALSGSCLHVEKANGNEVLSALNHKDYTLPPDAILIRDKNNPVCIAGIIGDERTSIKESTQNIAIEAAQFCPQTIRKTTKAIGFRSDSSNRFENQIDPLGLQKALEYASAMIQKECGGSICKENVSDNNNNYHPKFIKLRLKKIQSIIGISLSSSEVESFLRRLSMQTKLEDDTFHVRIPSYRNDITEEIDLVEEILRLYGYNNIKKVALHCTLSGQEHHKLYQFKRTLNYQLQSLGFNEFISCNLISDKEGSLESQDLGTNQELIEVLHAKSQDQSILRPSLLSGFLNAARINQRQKFYNLRSFEIGHTYVRYKGKIQEKLSLALLLGGQKQDFHYKEKSKDVNFFTLKGILMQLFESLKIPEITFVKSKSSLLHPHQQVQIFSAKTTIGIFGNLHPNLLNSYDCSAPLFFAQLDVANLLALSNQLVHYTALSTFPSSTRDLTLTKSKTIPLSQFEKAINNIHCSILQKFELIDVFNPENAIDKQNITFRFTYRDKNKTLKDKEVQEAHNRITKSLNAL